MSNLAKRAKPSGTRPKYDSEYVRVLKEEMKEKELEKAKCCILEDKEQKRKRHWDKHKHDTLRPFYHHLSVIFKSTTNPDDSYSLPSNDSLTTPQTFFLTDQEAQSTIKK